MRFTAPVRGDLNARHQRALVLAEAGGLVPGRPSEPFTADAPGPAEREGEGHRFQDATLLPKYAGLKGSEGAVCLLPKSFEMESGTSINLLWLLFFHDPLRDTAFA